MFLGPIKALYSAGFYIENIKKSGWLAFGFVVWVFIISSVFIAVFTPITMRKMANEIIEKTASYTPDIIIEKGLVTVNDGQPLTITPQELDGYKVVFNTASKEPVYPTEMETSKTLFFVTSDTVYSSYNGQFQINKVPAELSMRINEEALLANKKMLADIILYSLIVFTILAQLVKIPLMLVTGFAVAVAINIYSRAGLGADKLLKLSCYMQAPVTVLFMINYVSPVKIPLIMFVYLLIFGIYSYLVIFKLISSAENK